MMRRSAKKYQSLIPLEYLWLEVLIECSWRELYNVNGAREVAHPIQL